MRQILTQARERLLRFALPNSPVQQKSFCENDSLFLYVIFIKNAEDKFMFLTIDEVWKVIHLAEEQEIRSVSDLFGVKQFTIAGTRITLIRNEHTGELEGKSPQNSVFELPFQQPVYHDYDNPALYSWKGTIGGGPAGDIPGYEMDYFIYRVLTSNIAFNVFSSQIAEVVAKEAKYDESEKRQFYQELLSLHTKLMSRSSQFN